MRPPTYNMKNVEKYWQTFQVFGCRESKCTISIKIILKGNPEHIWCRRMYKNVPEVGSKFIALCLQTQLFSPGIWFEVISLISVFDQCLLLWHEHKSFIKQTVAETRREKIGSWKRIDELIHFCVITDEFSGRVWSPTLYKHARTLMPLLIDLEISSWLWYHCHFYTKFPRFFKCSFITELYVSTGNGHHQVMKLYRSYWTFKM